MSDQVNDELADMTDERNLYRSAFEGAYAAGRASEADRGRLTAERDDLSGAIERALHKAKTNEWHAMVAILTEAHTADPTRQPTA